MAAFQKFRSKPVVIEAVQLTKDNTAEVKKLLGEHNYEDRKWDPVNLHVRTQEGVMTATPGYWIIKGTHGEYYPCADEVFKAKYERAA